MIILAPVNADIDEAGLFNIGSFAMRPFSLNRVKVFMIYYNYI